MKIDFNSEIPIYLQLAQSVEDSILKGIYEEDTQIPSTTEISVTYKINPATVGKGYNLLVDEGIIYKKRGVGMFVTVGAKEKLMDKRRESFYKSYVETLIEEGKKLNISIDEIIKMLERSK
ncbi:DNA-binding transcriptional regulator YhcF (GntR family) [Clostridium punense]|uniref:DNA-binding transcriptional regulator YhcF (GntR family) n=1 Tax=Clostridium punense TaxID=1054297 RepID=A0ABS4K5L6_9CLOT|nr:MULTISPECIES: GntR family transcriptional regulator [Clostridium]EQB89191.1 GntR family transcriptional regulator [Clostridium sp. BL8]MBP2023064.1 DNA-binding transcriptional regulator YhcF (GntR family) [Clostridium punense]